MTDFAITPRVPSNTPEQRAREHTPNVAAQPSPIEGSIDSSALGSGGFGMLRRLLMKGASALGLESQSTSRAPDSPSSTDVTRENEGPLSLANKLKRAMLTSSLVRGVIHLGESIVDLAYSAWERVTGSGQNAPKTNAREYQTSTYGRTTDTEAPRPTIEPSRIAVEVAKVLDEEKGGKESDLVSAALHQCAEAIRHKEEKEHEAAHREEQARVERTQHARELIEAIDARGGRIANNPKVQAILASLGTPYDSVEQAITQVIALQQEEDDIDVH
jgi:hypothetical protein